MIVLLVLAGLVGVYLLRRRAKRRLVAGLVIERPGYFIEPPGGRAGKLRDGAL